MGCCLRITHAHPETTFRNPTKDKIPHGKYTHTLTGQVVHVKKVHRLLKKNKLTNIQVITSDKILLDISPSTFQSEWTRHH